MSVLGKRKSDSLDGIDDNKDENKDEVSIAPKLKRHKLSNNKNTKNKSIILNVGGIEYEITKQKLFTQSSIFSMRIIKPSSDGIYYINRDAELFKIIFKYLECGELKLPKTWSNTALWQFYVEVKYYMIESLFDVILSKLFHSKPVITTVRDYIGNKNVDTLILYNPFGSVLMYYSKSKDAVPGTGTRESLSKCDTDSFNELSKINNWRHILSNFYQLTNKDKLFDLDDLSWISVEHYFQAAKFKDINYAYYKSFSLDSGSTLSKAEGKVAKKAGGKKGIKLDDSALQQWTLRKHGVMQKALYAKFTQNKDIGKILKMTNNAKLLHSPGRTQPITEYDLMIIRNYLY